MVFPGHPDRGYISACRIVKYVISGEMKHVKFCVDESNDSPLSASGKLEILALAELDTLA
jgi:hypothetical protein